MVCLKYAPIIIFAYNRPLHLQRVLDALSLNKEVGESELYIYCDGEKQWLNHDLINATRKVAKKVNFCKKLTVFERESNIGLADSIINGVTEIVSQHGCAIVLEDDIVVSPFFLQYMNEALDIYKEDNNIACIHGYVYPIKKKLPQTFFLKGADCWGWATWKRAWDYFEPDGRKLLQSIKDNKLEYEFNFNGAIDYTGMLADQIAGINNSWAVRWYASAFLNNMLTLYPGKTLVINIGLDGSGTHAQNEKLKYKDELAENPIKIGGIKIKKHIFAYHKFCNYFKPFNLINWIFDKKKTLSKHLRKLIKYILMRKQESSLKYGWSGDYDNWQDALKKCTGYDSDDFINKVIESSRKVRDGEAIFERDSCLFDTVEYSWPITAYLLKAALENNNKLCVLDFGGSLGSHYYQNKKFLESIDQLKWVIVEQEQIVNIGKKEFQNTQLLFSNTLENALADNNFDVVLFSSIIPYIEKYEEILKIITEANIKYIFFDRTFIGSKEQITVQNVNPALYQASYPARIITKKKLFSFLLDKHILLLDFIANDGELFSGVESRGFIWKRRV